MTILYQIKPTFQDSTLTTVPGAVNKFPYLQQCQLVGNKIRSIERHSIENLRYLTTLFLNDNPIVFISRDAFRNVPSLTHLGLTNTQLTAVPPLIETLPSLRIVYLRDSPITCTCEFPRVTSQLTIGGFCDVTYESISDFIRTTLPQCP